MSVRENTESFDFVQRNIEGGSSDGKTTRMKKRIGVRAVLFLIAKNSKTLSDHSLEQNPQKLSHFLFPEVPVNRSNLGFLLPRVQSLARIRGFGK